MSRRLRYLFLLSLAVGVGACGDSMGPEEEEEEEITDPCQLATPINVGQALSGTLATGDCLRAGGALSDRWSLTVSQGMWVRIDLSSSAFDAFLELQSATGAVIAFNDDSPGSLDSRILQELPSGTYVIVATSFGTGETGAYGLSVTEASDCSTVGTLVLGQAVTGALEADDCIPDITGVMDNWALTVATGDKLRFEIASSDFDPWVLLRDVNGNILGVGGPIQADLGRLEQQVPAGEYIVSAAHPDESRRGSYQLIVDVAPPCDPGIDFVLGDTVQASLAPDTDCLFEGFAFADSFGIQLADETPVRIHMKSADFSPALILRDDSGFDIELGFDTAFDGNARIRRTLDAGSYALYATSFDFQPEGDYQLVIAEIVCGAPMPIAYGEELEGTLDESDCLRGNGAFQEMWELDLANDTTVRIDLTSKVFDTFLILMDSAGVVIESDDDGGTDLNSRIERDLTVGTYLIAASAFGGGDVGAYTLAVDAPAATPAAVASPGGASAVKKARPRGPSLMEWPSPLMRWAPPRGKAGEN